MVGVGGQGKESQAEREDEVYAHKTAILTSNMESVIKANSRLFGFLFVWVWVVGEELKFVSHQENLPSLS